MELHMMVDERRRHPARAASGGGAMKKTTVNPAFPRHGSAPFPWRACGHFLLLVAAVLLLPGLFAGCSPPASLCVGMGCPSAPIDIPSCDSPPGLTKPPSAPVPLFPLEGAIQRASGAGTLPGEGHVTSTGEYSYRLPLALPPGRAGVAPSLALVYGSRGKNDQLGVGFQLEGLSTITRCPSTLATEGYADGVHLDAHDAFCLDGHKLVLIAGLGGETDSEYRGEDGLFAKVLRRGRTRRGAGHFLVYTKDGRIRRYDPIVLSQKADQDRIELVFPLAEERDRAGNAIRYTYRVDIEQGESDAYGNRRIEYHPSTIEYTLFAPEHVTVEPPRHRVVFEYEERPDPFTVYLGGVALTSTQRISALTVSHLAAPNASELSARYTFSYEQSDGSGRSLLTRVERCGALGGCLLEKLFHWQSGGGPSLQAIPIEALPPDGETPFVLDVDGDGKDELLSSRRSLRFTTDKALPLGHRVELGADPTFPGFDELILEKSLVLDIEGDGIHEIIGPIASDDPSERGYFLFRYDDLNQRFYRVPGAPIEPLTHDANASQPFEEPITLADLDGDGLADLVKAEAPDQDAHWHWFYRHNEGGSFGPKIPIDLAGALPVGATMAPLASQATGKTFLFPLDLAGDYRGSVLFTAVPGTQPHDYGTLLGFRLDRQGNPEVVSAGARPSFKTTLYADMNGDGLGDCVTGSSKGILVSANLGRATGGRHLLDERSLAFAAIPFDGEHDLLQSGDLDADGKDEILAYHRNALGTDELTILRLGPKDTLEVFPEGLHARSSLGDFDGDGLLDLASWSNGLFTVDRGTGETFDRVSAVYDALVPHPLEAVEYATEPLALYGVVELPSRRMTTAFTVVREHRIFQGSDTDSPATPDHRLRYHYRGPLADLHGRGFLGFSLVTTWDPDRLAETVTTYDNITRQGSVHPFAFLPASIQRAVMIDTHGGKRARIERIDTQYSKDLLDGGKTYFVHPSSFRSLEWEEDVSLDALESAELHLLDIDGADEHSALRVRHGSTTYDAWGNVLIDERRTLHGVETRTVSTYEIRQDDWLIGLLETRVTRSGLAGAHPPPVERHLAYEYTSTGQLCHVFLEKDDLDPSLPEVLTYSRDETGQVVAFSASAIGVPTRTTHVAYDAHERAFVAEVWNDLGHAEWFLHDPLQGTLVAAEDPNGFRRFARHDDLGRLVEEIREGFGSTSFTYDARPGEGAGIKGLRVSRDDSSGASSHVDYDELGRVVGRGHQSFDGRILEEATRFDLLGRPVWQSRPGFGAPSAAGTTRRYDGLDRPTQEIAPGNAVTSFTHTFLTTHIDDPMLHAHEQVRDLDDRVIESRHFLEGKTLSTRYRYGDFDQVVRITDPLGNEVVSAYDCRGRRWFSSDPDAGSTHFTYNGLGDLEAKVDSGAHLTRFTYDALSRLTQIDDGDGTTHHVWDTRPQGLGKLAHSESPDGVTTDFTYDALGRLHEQTWTVDGEPFSFAVSYDDEGRVEELRYPAVAGKAPFTLGHHYTETGYLDAVYDAAAPDLAFVRVLAEDIDDLLSQGTLGNGIALAHSRDPDTGRLSTLSEGSALSLHYDYDFDGAVHQRRDLLANRVESFERDPLHRLSRWTLSSVIAGPPGFPEATPTLHDTLFTHDTLGNLREVTRDGVVVVHNVYGEDGRPHTLTSGLGGARLYDDRGRQWKSPGRTLTFTERNLPRTLDTNGGQTHFFYDAAGARVKKIGPGTSVLSLHQLYERREEGGQVRHVFTIEGGEGPVAQRSYDETTGLGSTVYLHRDGLGSVGALSDEAGGLLRSLYYEPFGERRDADGDPVSAAPSDPRQGFTGHDHDDELGLIDMRGRIYDPAERRFLTPDPHVSAPLFGQSYNRYSYVAGDPVNRRDPTGLDWWTSTSGGCGFEMSCAGTSFTEVSISISSGGPGDGSQGSSTPNHASGAPVVASKPQQTPGVPTGASLLQGALKGPPLQAWAERHGAIGAFAAAALGDHLKSAVRAPIASLLSIQGAGKTGLVIGQALSAGDLSRAGDAAARLMPVVGSTLALRDLYWSHDWHIASAEMKAEAIAHAVPMVGSLALEAGSLTGALPGAGKAGAAEETVSMYRAVSPGELYDVMKTGTFRPAPGGGSLAGKQFGLNLAEVVRFADQYPDLAAVLKVEVPKSTFSQFHFSSSIDPFIFKSGVVTVQPAQQALLNQTMISLGHAF
jgi:RHS repeat-associated protein